MENRTLQILCPALEGGVFPVDCTGRGRDLSPEFQLQNLSPDAVTLAVTLEDLSHPIRNFTHWVIWDLPAGDRIAGSIPAGTQLPGGARQGVGYGLHRYAGPKPPRGKRHTYRFTVYALDCRLKLGAWTGKRSFLKKARGHILQSGQVIGTFE